MSNVMDDLQKSINAWAVRKEWRGPNATPRAIEVDVALFHSECSEALEELRSNADPQHVWFSYECVFNGKKFKNLTADQYHALTGEMPTPGSGKPEGFGPECADIVIRVLETCEEYGLNLYDEINRKMTYNETREVRHGGKLI